MNSQKNNNYYATASFLLIAFTILGYTVKFYPDWLITFDQNITAIFRDNLTDFKTNLFKTITYLGDFKTLTLLVILLSLLLITTKRYIEVIWLIFNTAIGAGLLNYLIKFAYKRPRPGIEHLVEANHYSFPSGHAMASLMFYGSIIYLAHILIKHTFIKLTIQAISFVLILAIGISRVYLGVHFPTDIIGGYLLAGSCFIASLPFFKKYRFIWRFKGKQK